MICWDQRDLVPRPDFRRDNFTDLALPCPGNMYGGLRMYHGIWFG